MYPQHHTANSKQQNIHGEVENTHWKYLGKEISFSKINDTAAVLKISKLVYICWMIWAHHMSMTMVKPREFLLQNWRATGLMDGVLDEELSGQLCLNSYGQLLNVQVETCNEWCPSHVRAETNYISSSV